MPLAKHSNGAAGRSHRAALPKVLAVDDFNLNLLVMKNALSDIVNLYTVKSAIDALRVLDLVKLDLILLDLEMPEMSGFDFLEHLRTQESYEKLPVIIVTANANFKALKKGVQLGIVDYITKPFDPLLLRQKVVKALSSDGKAEDIINT